MSTSSISGDTPKRKGQNKMWRRNRQKHKLGEQNAGHDHMKENRRSDPNVIAPRRRSRRNQQGDLRCTGLSGLACTFEDKDEMRTCTAGTSHAFALSTADHEKSCRFHRQMAQLYAIVRDTSLDTSLQHIYMTSSSLLQNSEGSLTDSERTHR